MFRNSRAALPPRPRKACPGIIYNCYLLCKFNSFHYGKSAFILVMTGNMNNDYECSCLRVGVIMVFVKRKFYCANHPLWSQFQFIKKRPSNPTWRFHRKSVVEKSCSNNASIALVVVNGMSKFLRIVWFCSRRIFPPFAPSCWEWRLNFVSISFPQEIMTIMREINKILFNLYAL